jgi:hypothetical protein
MSRKLLAVMAALMLMVVAGCGGGGDNKEAGKEKGGKAKGDKPAATATKSDAKAYDKSAAGSIKGVVNFEGEAPKREPVDIAGDKYCSGKHQENLLTEEVVVNDGKLQNAVVYISKGQENFKDYPVPATEVVLDQVGCQYKPHVLAAQKGQKVVARNSDDTKHNVHLKGAAGDLNLSQDTKGQTDPIPEAKLEVDFISIGCDVHKWMKAKLAVFDHPFFAVTDEKGEFEIKGVPDGEYEVSLWHESADKKVTKTDPVTVKVSGGAVATKDFTVKKK